MAKRIRATDAKNNFGGLLEDVTALGRVEIARHGRLVAIVLSPRALSDAIAAARTGPERDSWGRTHMIPADLARRARIVKAPDDFDDE
jgi:prevent-host-death family protein